MCSPSARILSCTPREVSIKCLDELVFLFSGSHKQHFDFILFRVYISCSCTINSFYRSIVLDPIRVAFDNYVACLSVFRFKDSLIVHPTPNSHLILCFLHTRYIVLPLL